MKEWYSAGELAGLPGVPGTVQNVNAMSRREHWERRKREGRGGGQEYNLSSLPDITRVALVTRAAAEDAAQTAALNDDLVVDEPSGFSYHPDALWKRASRKTDTQRAVAQEKRAVFVGMTKLMADLGWSQEKALKTACKDARWSYATLRDIWHGRPGKPGLKLYRKQDWAAALVTGHRGTSRRVTFDEAAWEWFKSQYLQRSQPSIKETYRRLREVASAHSWSVPSERTVERRVREDIPLETLVLKREGPEALNSLLPKQRRDKTVFHAGEAVNGDGLKFDRLWVKFPDGEIINTATSWVWQDIYSSKILAHRVDKTENTDLFRLATYDLTAICVPTFAWMDNTRVAANKAMTGGAKGRYRFKDQPDDPMGLLLQLGIEPRFTNPDHNVSNPGTKPVERAFGVGGLHEMVATAPEFSNRGYSKATAIELDEFRAVLAREIGRFNARPNRRSAVCQGTKSFNEAFEESFSKALVRRASEDQRRLLLLMPEVVFCQRKSGELQLRAGAGPNGRPRYHSDTIAHYRGQNLVAYYDPADLRKPVTVYDLSGVLLGTAERMPDTAFNDTAASREWNKNKKRRIKAIEQQSNAETRMTALEYAALYPNPAEAPPPEPGVVRPNFSQRLKVAADGTVIDTAVSQEEQDEMQANFARNVIRLAQSGD